MRDLWDRWDVPSWLLAAALWTISVVVWDRVPEEMPTRWDAAGAATATTSREFGLLILPLAATAAAVALTVAWKAVFLKQSPRAAAAARWARRGLLGAATVVHVAAVVAAVNGSMSVPKIAVTATGVLLILVAYRVPTYVRRGVLRKRAEPSGKLLTKTNGLSVGMLTLVGVGTVAAAGLSLAAQLAVLVVGTVVACVLIAMAAG